MILAQVGRPWLLLAYEDRLITRGVKSSAPSLDVPGGVSLIPEPWVKRLPSPLECVGRLPLISAQNTRNACQTFFRAPLKNELICVRSLSRLRTMRTIAAPSARKRT